jgi:hypothetical protein
MSTKILSHSEQVRNVIERHEHYLAGEAAKAVEAQRAIEEQAAREAEKLQPVRDSLDALNNRFGALVKRHDDLTGTVRIGEIRLAQQRQFASEFSDLCARVFASTDHGRTPVAYDVTHAIGLNPHLSIAAQIVPHYERLLAAAVEALADVEADLLALSQTAKLPQS